MKKTILTRVLALIGAVIAVVSMTIVPAFADDESPFLHSYADFYEMFSGTDRSYSYEGGYVGEWQVYGSSGIDKYTEFSQEFFDQFPSSAGKYIMPMEYVKADENGVYSLVEGYNTITCPAYFELDYCAVMVVRMNARGQLYRFWMYAENFKLKNDVWVSWDHDPGDGQQDFEHQNIQIEYDVIESDLSTWWQEAYEADVVPDWKVEYWERDLHVDYSLTQTHSYAFGDFSTYVYDTMRLHDTNASNYTLCYAVVSLEQIMVNYESKMSYYEGYGEGYDVGYAEGGEAGRFVGYQDGYSVGYTEGEAEGWKNGEAHGITETQDTVKGVKEVVFAIFDAPTRLIDGMLDFNLFGVNLASTVKVIVTLAVVSVIIAVIIKFSKG